MDNADGEVAQQAATRVGECWRLFTQADADMSGHLDRVEIRDVITQYHKTEGKLVSKSAVKEEVERTICDYAAPGASELVFPEFVAMLFGSKVRG